jgi:TorA maturation chaperone TorD
MISSSTFARHFLFLFVGWDRPHVAQYYSGWLDRREKMMTPPTSIDSG